MAKSRPKDYLQDPVSLRKQNTKLLREQGRLRDQTRALLDERAEKDKALQELWGELHDILRYTFPGDDADPPVVLSHRGQIADRFRTRYRADEVEYAYLRQRVEDAEVRAFKALARLAEVQDSSVLKIIWMRLKEFVRSLKP